MIDLLPDASGQNAREVAHGRSLDKHRVSEAEKAFAVYGLTDSSTKPDEAARMILSRPQDVSDEILMTLDLWLVYAARLGQPTNWVRDVLFEAEAEADRIQQNRDRSTLHSTTEKTRIEFQRQAQREWRRDVRTAIAQRDLNTLVAITATPHELQGQSPALIWGLAATLVHEAENSVESQANGPDSPDNSPPIGADGAGVWSREQLESAAMDVLQKMQRFYIDDVLLNREMARLLQSSGQFEDAARHLMIAAASRRSDGKSRHVHHELARLLVVQDDIDGAFSVLRRLVAQHPDPEDVLLKIELGNALLMFGDRPGEALHYYEAAIDVGYEPVAREWLRLANIRADEGHTAEAIAGYRHVIASPQANAGLVDLARQEISRLEADGEVKTDARE